MSMSEQLELLLVNRFRLRHDHGYGLRSSRPGHRFGGGLRPATDRGESPPDEFEVIPELEELARGLSAAPQDRGRMERGDHGAAVPRVRAPAHPRDPLRGLEDELRREV